MTCTLHVAWDDQLTSYDFGPQHPMAPQRLKLTIELAQASGLFHADGVSLHTPVMATDAELAPSAAPKPAGGSAEAGSRSALVGPFSRQRCTAADLP